MYFSETEKFYEYDLCFLAFCLCIKKIRELGFSFYTFPADSGKKIGIIDAFANGLVSALRRND